MASLGEDVKRKATEKFSPINEAYNELKVNEELNRKLWIINYISTTHYPWKKSNSYQFTTLTRDVRLRSHRIWRCPSRSCPSGYHLIFCSAIWCIWDIRCATCVILPMWVTLMMPTKGKINPARLEAGTDGSGVVLCLATKPWKCFNVASSIEPHASAHIMEQIDFTQKIWMVVCVYESEGSVLFDVEKYNKANHYGNFRKGISRIWLKPRVIWRIKRETPRLWISPSGKSGSPNTYARWKSLEWRLAFRWHMECSAMGNKIPGEEFDIHGGGMDLMFPHHECEIAQSTAALGRKPFITGCTTWLPLPGQKMGKSLKISSPSKNFHRKPQTANQGIQSDDHPFLYFAGTLPQHGRFQQRSAQASKGTGTTDGGYPGCINSPPEKIDGGCKRTARKMRSCHVRWPEHTDSDFALVWSAGKPSIWFYDGKETISAADLDELKSVFGLS